MTKRNRLIQELEVRKFRCSKTGAEGALRLLAEKEGYQRLGKGYSRELCGPRLLRRELSGFRLISRFIQILKV